MWEPIETAPRDGSPFMVWAEGYEWPEIVRWFDYGPEDAEEIEEPGYWHYADEALQNISDSPDLMADFSHWMPLPDPPIQAAKDGA